MSKGGKTGTKRARTSGGRSATQREAQRRRQRRQTRMRQITMIFGGLIGVAVLIVALAQSVGPGQANALPTPSATATATAATSPTPTPQQVSVSINETNITATITTFKAGTHYQIILKNTGHRAHQIVIAPPVTARTTQAQLEKETLVNIPEKSFAPGAMLSVDLVFPTPVAAGQLQLASLPTGGRGNEILLPLTVVKG